MSKELRLGVIGSGGRGGLAAFAHRPGRGSRIAACCDVDKATLEKNRQQYGADLFTTTKLKALLAQDLDAVFICSPDFLHEEQALATLAAGLPVYLEKPMAITIRGCDCILRLAKRKRVRLFVGHNMRYMNVIRKMKQLVDQGAIGTVKAAWCRHFVAYGGDAYFRDWHSERRNTTGLLLQKGAHDLDVLHWIAGGRTERVAAFGNLAVYGDRPRRRPGQPRTVWWNGANWPPSRLGEFSPRIDIEDQSVVIMEMERGVLGAYLQCHFSPDTCRNYTFIGDEGRLENLGDGPEAPIMLWNRRNDGYRLIGDQVFRGDQAADGGHGGADPLIVADFLNYVRRGTRTTATPQAARDAVATGCQATASLRQGGKPMIVPRLAPDLARHKF
jgi:predicted dehydrogenase